MRVGILVLLIISLKVAVNFAIERREQHNGEQKLLLRKLLSLQQNNSTEKALMWNEILANVMVNKIKIMFKKQPEYGMEDNPDIVTTFLSKVIWLFDKYVYKAHNKDDIATDNYEKNKTTEIINPKVDVEEVEAKYHGRIEIATDNINIEKRSVCPGDLVLDGNGNCVNPKNLPYIMAIPYQCPIGYRRDRLGYCRPSF